MSLLDFILLIVNIKTKSDLEKNTSQRNYEYKIISCLKLDPVLDF